MITKSVILVFVLCIFCGFACKSKVEEKVDQTYSGDQERIIKKVRDFDGKLSNENNQHIKNTMKLECQDSISKFIVDSMKNQIRNARVHMTRMIVIPDTSKHIFVAMFGDHGGNEYWMAFQPSEKDSIYNSYQYKFLKDLPKYKDTVISFFYMGDFKCRYDGFTLRSFKIRIMPFHKDFNFDEAAWANRK